MLNLGHECWVCFDTDLLRIAAVWRGKGVTDKALAPGSYLDAGRKTPGGQFPAPQPDGKQWIANGIYPGWQTGDRIGRDDPREPAPSVEEVGRGPLPEAMGRFKAVRLVPEGVVLAYDVASVEVSEFWVVSNHDSHPLIERHMSVGASTKPLLLVLGAKSNGPSQEIETGVTVTGGNAEIVPDETLWIVRVPAHDAALSFCISLCDEHDAPSVTPRAIPSETPKPRWPQEAISKIKPSTAKDVYVVDHIELPADNPWKRALRLGDIQFLKDGTGVGITVDGDVWLIRGLHEMNGPVRWKRFASGLHEPMTCAIRDEQIFVFDRNGIWKLRDTNGDGEADVHELFSNAFAQTADMREFPSTLRLAPGGEFVIAKGGQEATTLGKHNGSVLRISADGKKASVLGYGFRQPSIGVNLRTGLVTSSDQEGQYIPSTPLHIVRDHQFYGFLSDKLPKEKYPAPIAEPLVWMPHAVNSSAMSQVWLFDAKLGALNDSMVQICFNKPELLRVIMNERGTKLQASVVSITDEFDFPPLNGSVNPADGQLYLAGFQVIGWGNTLDTLAGLCRVRYTGAPSLLPREIVPMDQGVLLRFDVAVDPKKAADPASYSLATWGYKRAHTYGSAQYKADGSTGIDWLTPSSAYVSTDGRSVFVGVPGMKPVMQLRIGWSLASADGAAMEQNAYTTPHELVKFDAKAEGYGDITVDLTPRTAVAQAAGPITIEEGRRLSQMLGCVACHSVKDQDFFHIGPKWKGLFGTQRDYLTEKKAKGTIAADEAYLRESILQPNAKRHTSFTKSEYAMPSYAGVITDTQLESLVLYIKSLK
ncbi:cytochrome c [Prosthecobacter sp.]|uniref:cytochrome c n=1 Tax=Prosthecobacter sp. TaxID=1965333 RepID=UPI002ABB0840|nr:cytochrome c [Prosthecobacter sp.]MDZ4401416.1 cytochrome c [Prosthecobacter sp.]